MAVPVDAVIMSEDPLSPGVLYLGNGWIVCESWTVPAAGHDDSATQRALPVSMCLGRKALQELLYDYVRATPLQQTEMVRAFCERFGLE